MNPRILIPLIVLLLNMGWSRSAWAASADGEAAAAASLNEMMCIAGPNARSIATPHFVLVYTTDAELACRFAERLEVVHEQVERFMRQVEVAPRPTIEPLEVFLFSSREQFDDYGRCVGYDSAAVPGFYQRSVNRSAFFDMTSDPDVTALREQLARPEVGPRQRERLAERLERRMNQLNRNVVQHEAAHHVQFNLGLLDRRAAQPRWLTEGLAQLFESPPDLGAQPGDVNHFRLSEFRARYGRDGERLRSLREFMGDDARFDDEGGYALSWALCNYLWNERRSEFAAYLRAVAARPPGERLDGAAELRAFEQAFGEVDAAWVRSFNRYASGLRLHRAALGD